MGKKMNTMLIKQSTMLKPAEETPRQTLWLSSLDMIARKPLSHSLNVYVYHNPSKETQLPLEFFNVTLLRDTLCKALVPFYPMAGRLREAKAGRIELDCNGEGALFVEAETTYALSDVGDFYKPTEELRELVIPSCDYSGGLGSFPLVMIQVTRFRCGGLTLGFAQHHHVADGCGHVRFITTWASLTRGLDELEFMPFHERIGYLSPRVPSQIKFQHSEYEPPKALSVHSETNGNLEKEATTVSLFKLTKDQINAIKQKAMPPEENHKLSTFQALAGHIWRTTCKVRGLPYDQEVRLYIPTDGRTRLKDPALPEGFCGNAIFFPASVAKAGDIVENPLWYTASKIHDTLKRMDDEYLRSTIDYLESYSDFDALVHGPHWGMCPNMTLNSWTRLPLDKANFGWGSPILAVGLGRVGYEGQSYLLPDPYDEDGGLILSICLFTKHMEQFEKCLYDF